MNPGFPRRLAQVAAIAFTGIVALFMIPVILGSFAYDAVVSAAHLAVAICVYRFAMDTVSYEFQINALAAALISCGMALSGVIGILLSRALAVNPAPPRLEDH